MTNIIDYIDRSKLIKPHLAWSDASGDGCVFTSVAGLLGVYDREACEKALQACVDKRTGCLMRRPTNENGQQSHDGWMSYMTWLHFTGNAVQARGLLFSAFIHGFYLKHRPFELEGKPWKEKLRIIFEPWTIRFPKVWIVAIATAFPYQWVQWICARWILAFTFGSYIDVLDQSGIQLQWIDRKAMMQMGLMAPMIDLGKELSVCGLSMSQALSRTIDPFYDPDHVSLRGYNDFMASVTR